MNDSFMLNLIARLNKQLSKSAINGDLKTLNNTMSVRVIAKLSKALTSRELKKSLKELNNLYVNVGAKAKIDKNAKTKLEQEVKTLQKTIADLEIGLKASKLQQEKLNADIEAIRKNAQKKINSEPLEFSLQIKKDKLISDIEYTGKRFSKLFSSDSARKKYETIMQNALSVSDKGQLADTRAELSAFTSELKANGLASQSLSDKWKKLLDRAKELFSAATVIRTIFTQVKQSVSTFLQLDTAMTNLYKVQDQITSRDQFSALLTKWNKLAQELKVSTESLINSAEAWSKIGFDLKTSEELAKITTIFEKTAEISNEKANSTLVSVAQAFTEIGDLGEDDYVQRVEAIGNRINEIGNQYSINSEGIADALQNSSAALRMANNDLDESIAIVAASNKIFQSPDEVGNMAKVLSARLRGQKGELEELGESTEGVIESVSKIQTQILKLTSNRVNIFEDDNETLKSTYDIMVEIGKVYNSLSDKDQAELLEIIGGKQRMSAVASLLLNYKELEKIKNDSMKANGSMEAEYAKYAESAEASIVSFKEQLIETYSAFMSGDLIKYTVDVGSSILEIINKFDLLKHTLIAIGTIKIGKTISTLGGVIASTAKQIQTLGNALQQVKDLPLDNVLRKSALDNIGESTKSLTEKNLKLLLSQKELGEQDRIAILEKHNLTKEQAAEKLEKLGLTAATKENTAANVAEAGSINVLKGAFTGLKTSVRAAWAAMSALQKFSLIFTAVSTAWSVISSFIDSSNQKHEEARQKAIETANASAEEAKALQDAYIKYKQLASIQNRTESQENDFKTAVEDVTKALGEKKNALKDVKEGTEEYYQALEKASKEEFKQAYGDAKASYAAATNKLKDTDINGFDLFGLDNKSPYGFQKDSLEGLDSKEQKKAVQIIEKKLKEYKNEFSNGVFYMPDLEYDSNGHIKNPEKIIEFYTAMGSALDDLKQYEDINLTGTTAYEELSEMYGEISEITKECTEQQYAFLKSEYVVKNGIPETVEEYEKMKSSILKASGAGEEYKTVLEDMMDTDFSYLLDGFSKIADKQEELKDTSLPSFTDIFNSADFDSAREKLLKLAKSGEISNYTIESTKEYKDLIDKTGLSADEAKSKILDMLTPSERLDAASQGLSKLSKAYEEFKTNGYVTVSTIESLPDVFKKLKGHDFDLFASTIGDPTKTKEEIQQAFDDILTRYIADQQTMKGITTENEQFYITQLKEMGVANAETAAKEYLTTTNTIQNILNSYADYVRQKGAADNEHLKELCGGNEKLLNALTDTYSTDYDNWVKLLNQKATIYNKFAKEIEESQGVTGAAAAMAIAGKNTAAKAATENLALNLSTINTDFKGSYNGNKSTRDSLAKNKDKNKDNKETFDWIETAISRLNTALDHLKDKADDTYSSWTARNENLRNAITSTRQAIDLQAQAYQRYMAQAKSVSLSGAWKNLVQNGAIDISTISDESLAKNIKEYQSWYDKAQDCLKTQQELNKSLNELESKKFTNLQNEYESIIGLIETQKSLIEGQITVLSNGADYDRLRSEQNNIIANLRNERSALEATLNSLAIERGTEEWNNLQSSVAEISKSLQDAEKSLRDINRMQFDNLKQFYELSINLMEKQKDLAENRITLLSGSKEYESLRQQQQKIITGYDIELKKLNELKNSNVFSGMSYEDQMDVLSDIQDVTGSLEEARNALKEISQLEFNNIKEAFEFEIGILEHRAKLYDEQINLAETKGLFASARAHTDKKYLTRQQLSATQQERRELEAVRDASGYEIGTSEWNSMTSEIMSLYEQEASLTTELEEINNTLRELDWEVFDHLTDSVNDLISESDFLKDLMEYGKLIDDKGKFTDEGNATLALNMANADWNKQQSESYFAEAEKLKKEMGRNSGTDVLERYKDLIQKGQDSLLAYKSSLKDTISLIEERYQAELDALQKLINKKKEQLQEEKNLYDYQKSIREKTDNIASLEKQKAAYANDNSEETMARIQRIQLELKEAKEDLEETEYEKYLSDSQDMLDKLAEDYEDWMNIRLDNQEALIKEVAANVNSTGVDIQNTLREIAKENDFQLSEHMKNLFGELQVLSDRIGGGVEEQDILSGTEQALAGNRQDYMDNAGLLSSNTTIEKAQEILRKALNIIPNPEGYTIKDARKALAIALHLDKGYKNGTSYVPKDGVYWTQEEGTEAILSKTHGLLTPLKQGDMVLTAEQSQRIFDFAKNPSAFMNMASLCTPTTQITKVLTQPNINNINNGGIHIELPDVKDYNDFRAKLVKDKTFENAMCTMVNNSIMGKSTISKRKYM